MLNRLKTKPAFHQFLVVLLLILAQNAAGQGLPEGLSTKRHVYIVQSGPAGEVWGTYIFAVENANSSVVNAEFPIMLPTQTMDFRPQQGLNPEDIVMAASQQSNELAVRRAFEPGMNLISLSFVVSAEYGSAELTFKAPQKIEELLVMTPAGSIKLDSADMALQANEPFAGQHFLTLKKEDVQPGQILTVRVSGIAETRRRFYMLGLAFSMVLLVLAGVSIKHSRPKLI